VGFEVKNPRGEVKSEETYSKPKVFSLKRERLSIFLKTNFSSLRERPLKLRPFLLKEKGRHKKITSEENNHTKRVSTSKINT